MLQWTQVYEYLFTILVWVLLDMYPEMELLGHMITLLLTFWGTWILISTMAAPFYIPTKSKQRLQILHIPAYRYYLFFW